MNSNFINFLTEYIVSLKERTRDEKNKKKGILRKVGIDWVIYQLGISEGWVPKRLPFYRLPDEEDKKLKSKTEAEFGVDISFLKGKKNLIIFVLKDEPLKNKTWVKNGFVDDLQKAVYTDLSDPELSGIEKIDVILAYNKGEDNTGEKLFNNFVQGQPSKIGDKGISLNITRWNLTRIVEETQKNLLSPDLLPRNIAGQFNYICSQFKDFDFNSKEWETLLIPNWKNFLKNIIQESYEPHAINLIPVLMIILDKYKKDSPSAIAGWIDMLEWAMLVIFAFCIRHENRINKTNEMAQIWYLLYISSLDLYLKENEKAFTTPHGFSVNKFSGQFGLTATHESYAVYWQIARLGICSLAFLELDFGEKPENYDETKKFIQKNASIIASCINNNPAIFRPLIDLNHIELFLIWFILYQAGKRKEIYQWLDFQEKNLLMRRLKNHAFPFIESRNRIDLVAKYAAIGNRPIEYSDSTSYLILMLLEFCCCLPDKQKKELLRRYCKRIVEGKEMDGLQLAEKPLDLMAWTPPDDWNKRVLTESVTDGIGITIGTSDESYDNIENYLQTIRTKYPQNFEDLVPVAVYVLACIKNKSPLPAKYWRELIFRNKTKEKVVQNR